jgi:cytochrome b561
MSNGRPTTDREAMEKFSLTARTLHWAIALLLLIQIPLAWYMIELPLSLEKLSRYSLHKSIGTLLFTLAILRLMRAILEQRPALPAGTKPREKILAKATQGLLYLLVLSMPISGWVMSSAANVPVTVFGMFTLPPLVTPDKALLETMKSIHEAQSIALLVLVSLHFAAGLKHHFMDRDNVLYSMLPFVGKR